MFLRNTFFAVLVLTAVQGQLLSELNAAQGLLNRILIIDDETAGYYRFEGTAPLMQKSLNAHKGNEAVICGDAEVLATDVLFDYNVLFIHFKNYKKLKRHEQAKKNLEKFVQDGGGLFIFHFGCGIFEEWTDIDKIIGRAFEPDAKKCTKGQYHDRYGKFTVRIVDKEHPVTQGLNDFETQDELYHCFKPSSTPITVLAESTSNLDGKSYPMAFVLQYGKGRIFHTTLGHDAASVNNPGFVALLLKAVAWCGGTQGQQ